MGIAGAGRPAQAPGSGTLVWSLSPRPPVSRAAPRPAPPDVMSPDLIADALGRFNYLAPFTVLFLCGVGLPIPEEVTLIGAGLLLHAGEVGFLPITAVCSAAILLGDSVPYWIGRRWGLQALQVRWVGKLLHPERFARLQKRFEEHGQWATFGFRFVMGLRIPGYFMAGMLGMGYARFLVLDALGVLITVPVSIWLGSLFGDQVDRLHATMGRFHLVLAFVVVLAVALMLVWRWRARSRPEGAGSGPGGNGSGTEG